MVTVVVINEPKGENYGGGSAAAPVYSRITEGALRLLNIPPTELPSPALETAGAAATAGGREA
jgi:cell division protein FtsI (penicillin-binding protein 3)